MTSVHLLAIDLKLLVVTEKDNTVSELINNTESALDGRGKMPTKSKSRTIIKREGRLPKNRPPTHPGEMLLEEFIKPLGLTQTEFAKRINVSYQRLNEIIKKRRSVTPDTALRLAKVLKMSANYWLGLQLDWDLWHAMHGPKAKDIEKIKPLDMKNKEAA